MGAVLFFLAFWAVIFAVYLIMLPNPVNKAKQIFVKSVTWIRELVDDPGEAARVLAIAGITIALLGFVWLYVLNRRNNFVSDFYANVATELLSIAVTVLIIDQLYARRSAKEEKQRIIRQLASYSNEFALEAVRLCREDGRKWLTDGSLDGAFLWRTNLKGANLIAANFKGADLTEANLEDAVLITTNFEGAVLWAANLQGAALWDANLRGTFLPDANLKDAALQKADLEGAILEATNLEGAILEAVNLKDALYNEKTVWPDGFSPLEAGARQWDEMSEDVQQQWKQRHKVWWAGRE